MKGRLLLALFCLLFQLVKAQDAGFKAGQLGISWKVIENDYEGSGQCATSITLSNHNQQPLPAKGWKIYFNFARPVNKVLRGPVQVAHVNGDLFVITPTENFTPLAAGDSLQLDILSADWVVNFTDAPNGFFLVWNNNASGENLPPVSIQPSTTPKQYLRFKQDKIGLITPQDIYNQNLSATNIPASQLTKIFPTPLEYFETGDSVALSPAMKWQGNAAFAKEQQWLQQQLAGLYGKNKSLRSGTASLYLLKGAEAPGAYHLRINKDSVVISAGNTDGIFYGMQSLLSLIPPAAWAGNQQALYVPTLQVYDAPRFGYRAFMLDVARNFQTKAAVLKVLDVMALYKLNVFHLHFSDDEGWRIQIPGLPELTDLGSRRGFTNGTSLPPSLGSGAAVNNTQGTGFYTRADFIEILQYATARHIAVIPEIEAPGHGRAAIRSMEARYKHYMAAGDKTAATQYLLQSINDTSVYHSVQNWNDNVMDPSLPSVYTFMEKVVDELRAMYREAGAPLQTIHMGGDEVPAGVWEKSPAFEALKTKDASVATPEDVWYYFYGKLNQLLQQRGLFLSGWEETAMRKTKLDGKPYRVPNPRFISTPFQLDVWNNVLGDGDEDLAYRLANAGYKVVLSCVTNNYLDMAYYKAFEEPGYYWGAFVDIDKPFSFIPYDYFKNTKEDKFGNPIDSTLFIGKQRLSDYGKTNIVGMKGLLWAETLVTQDRMEYMLMPKLLAIAERAWSKDPDWAVTADKAQAAKQYQKDWSSFVNRVAKRELPRLDYYAGGFNYRIPQPGAAIVNHAVAANLQLPGLAIRYTTNGETPDSNSPLYSVPIPAKGTIKLKAFDTRGRGGREAVVNGE